MRLGKHRSSLKSQLDVLKAAVVRISILYAMLLTPIDVSRDLHRRSVLSAFSLTSLGSIQEDVYIPVFVPCVLGQLAERAEVVTPAGERLCSLVLATVIDQRLHSAILALGGIAVSVIAP